MIPDSSQSCNPSVKRSPGWQCSVRVYYSVVVVNEQQHDHQFKCTRLTVGSIVELSRRQDEKEGNGDGNLEEGNGEKREGNERKEAT